MTDIGTAFDSLSYAGIGSVKDKQIEGNHYKSMAIQPLEFAMANKLDPCQAKVIKYVCRHASKAREKDLDKAIHMIEWMKEFYYGTNA